ncbi:hypothetical protein M3Y99_01812200 [Aphelenchoides fujianensis]|nr:hypothetical protein M3Y99_01812200 [Aphelenchoides fujianensis]
MTQATRIVQLPSVRQCECPMCWTKPWSVPRDHLLQNTTKSVVYEEHNSLTGKMRCSKDGRYMFYLSRMKELHVVDLVRNSRQMLKPEQHWPFFHYIHDFVIVNSMTLLVHVNYYDEVNALLLIRLRDADGIYERVLLHRLEDYSPASFVLTEISGQNVEVKRAVLNNEGHCSRFVFLSVNIDEARAFVHHEATLNEDAINDEDPTVLHVYSLGQRNWTREALDVQMLYGKKVLSGFTSSMPEMYLLGHEEQNIWSPWIFRCNLAARKWEGVAIGEYGAQHLQNSAPVHYQHMEPIYVCHIN